MTEENYLKKLADMQTQIKKLVPDQLKENGERRMTILKEMIVRYETDGRIVKGYDAGELIRCKDCKHWDGDSCHVEVWNSEDADSVILDRHADDYCSRAERKEE